MTRSLFIDAVGSKNDSGQLVFGTGTFIVCRELMEQVGVCFPQAYLDPEKIAALPVAGHTFSGFDVPECASPLTTPLANLKAVAARGRT